MMTREKTHPGLWLQKVGVHAALLLYTAIAISPVLLILLNSVKSRRAIFQNPFSFPTAETFDLVGYETVIQRSHFDSYFLNSFIVTSLSLLLILAAGTMAAYALSEYKFKGNALLGLYMAVGIMIPIRLGTVALLIILKGLGLASTLAGLILVYTASGLPLAVFVLSQFMRQVPHELKDAARVDGASEYRIYWMTLPLVRPAIGTVLVINMIPIWNDLWFPLVLASAENTKTLILGAQTFLGQFVSDWNAVLASLTLSMLPVIVLYFIFSRQLIRGLTAGAVK